MPEQRSDRTEMLHTKIDSVSLESDNKGALEIT